MIKLRPWAASSLFALSLAAAGQAIANEDGIVMKQVSSNDSSYCHIKYMAFTEQSLRTGQHEFDPSNVVDFYGSCSFDPKSPEEVKKQVALVNRGVYGDSGSDSGSSE